MKKLYLVILFALSISIYAQNKSDEQIIQTIENGVVTFKKMPIKTSINNKKGNSIASINTIEYLPNESFETFIPTGWDVFVAGPSEWLQDGGEFNTGNASAYSAGEPYADTWLITPQIDLTTATSAFVSYYELFYPGVENLDEHNVYVSFDYTNNGNPFSANWNLISSGVNNLYTWELRQFDLTVYLGSPIYIAFEYFGNDDGSGNPPSGFDWYIDDVSVTDDGSTGSAGCTGTEPVPDCAIIKSPPDGATFMQTDVNVFWNIPNFEDITKQFLYVGTDGGGTTTPTNLHNGTEYSANAIGVTLINLTPNTTYYWQVIGANCSQEAQNCPIWAFTTGDGEANFGSGGSTQGGYTFANSTSVASGAPSQPSYNWIDISGSGTDLISTIGDEETKGPFNIGFPFKFFDNTYSQFYINSNGFVTFAPTAGQTDFPHPIPSTSIPDDIIAAFWMDLNPTNTNVVNKHLYYGMSGGDMVITYEKYPQFMWNGSAFVSSDVNGWITFQIILKPDGDIKIQYKEKGSSFVDSDFYTGSVGIENSDGTKGTLYRSRTYGGPIWDGTSPLALEFSNNSEIQQITATSGTVNLNFSSSNVGLALDPTQVGSLTVTKFDGAPTSGSFAGTGVNSTIDDFWQIVNSGVLFSNGIISIPLSIIPAGLDPNNLVWVKRANSGDPWTNVGGVVNGLNFESTVPFNSFSEFTIGYFEAAMNVKIMLEGPYNTGVMNNLLTVPASQPYSSPPWSYEGGETTTSTIIADNNVVDWVLVELRTGSSASNATNIVDQRAVLLTQNGDILETDGSVNITFPNAQSGVDYYLAVFHRNHLPVISSQIVTF